MVLSSIRGSTTHGIPLGSGRRALGAWTRAVGTALATSAAIAACAADGAGAGRELTSFVAEALSQAERIARYGTMKDAAAARGIDHTAYLLAGIAYAETGLAHCWSEAQWACQGPGSPDCGGGPVIAGSGDGPCADQQGGLGMFQFDAGTYADTLNAYGADVLTVAGNTSHAIDYVVHMVKISSYTTNAETDAKALAWVAGFDVGDGALRDQWIKTVTHYYNGCKPAYACWAQRYAHYDDSLQTVIDETGLPFWVSAPPDQPPAGWIEAAGCDVVKGWSQDPDAATTSIDVHLYYGGAAGSGAPSVAVHADVPRDDLCQAIGSCAHGFVALPPLSLFDGQPHPVHAYGIGAAGQPNRELDGSPLPLTCAATLPAGVRRHVVSPASYEAWRLDDFADRMPAPEAAVLALPAGPDVPVAPRIVASDDGSPAVWVVDGDVRRHVESPASLAAWRFDAGAVEKLPAAEVEAIEVGKPWRPRPVAALAGGAVYLVDEAPADVASGVT